jgi:hypothetical protein
MPRHTRRTHRSEGYGMSTQRVRSCSKPRSRGRSARLSSPPHQAGAVVALAFVHISDEGERGADHALRDVQQRVPMRRNQRAAPSICSSCSPSVRHPAICHHVLQRPWPCTERSIAVGAARRGTARGGCVRGVAVVAQACRTRRRTPVSRVPSPSSLPSPSQGTTRAKPVRTVASRASGTAQFMRQHGAAATERASRLARLDWHTLRRFGLGLLNERA